MPDTPVLAQWQADRTVYIRDSVRLAALCMIGATAALYLMGNANYWVGAVGALLAIGIRNGYLASEELAMTWELRSDILQGSNGRSAPVDEIVKVRRLGSAVQIITRSGDKFLMKYLADPLSAQSRIAAAAGISQ